ncbi:Fe-S cluster assembly ATPase SufC [Aliifodinibius salipaludis]|uniref:Fe-S cluster assembly ATPase SufC n=1 Tax=Fodinibius salipaludis TaxID=2032627 RepID=A0A2A2GAE0_9BACT|nr:Fe-S cluster assembly ATPase SufC [Aliifodinibius salipaludis]PAU93805.1 Fe-S cluster assembly ATPase SufC [Aliifodinibius salipaludis]
MLEIKDLHVCVEEDPSEKILKGVNLTINEGEIHAIMGPNGSGKSTLSKVVAGHEAYEVTQGDILYNGESILDLEADERAHLGIFLAFQYPVEVPGVTNKNLLRQAYNTIAEEQGREELDPLQFEDHAREQLKLVDMKEEFLERSVNAGFSGGEKKRNEIFQMAVLQPKLSFLDETDSGLDIDALKIVANGINELSGEDNAVVLVTHYQRILDYVQPDHVHVMIDGKIAKSGDKDLAIKLEEQGYDWLTDTVSVNGEQQ